jgi:hypothetical protein
MCVLVPVQYGSASIKVQLLCVKGTSMPPVEYDKYSVMNGTYIWVEKTNGPV